MIVAFSPPALRSRCSSATVWLVTASGEWHGQCGRLRFERADIAH
jgi:hypothetical protein